MELSCEPLWLSLTPSLISIQQKSLVLPYTQALGVIFGVFFPLRAARVCSSGPNPEGDRQRSGPVWEHGAKFGGVTQRAVLDTWSAWRASKKLLCTFLLFLSLWENSCISQPSYHTGSTWAINQPAPPGWKRETRSEQWAIPHLLWHECWVLSHESRIGFDGLRNSVCNVSKKKLFNVSKQLSKHSCGRFLLGKNRKKRRQ